MWKVVTNSNLNPPLKLFFYSPILNNNNLLLKIYCENIVVLFFDYDFLFFILFFFLSFHFHPFTFHFFFSFFFFLLFSSTQVSNPPSFIFFFTSRTFQQLICFTSERERERTAYLPPQRRWRSRSPKGQAGGDRHSPRDTTTSAAAPPPPTAHPPPHHLG